MSISDGNSDGQEHRPFYGSLRPKVDDFPGPRYPITHPLTQANFVGVFTVLTIVIYTVALWFRREHSHIPPLGFYLFVGALFILCWGSLYLEYMPVAYWKFKRWLRRQKNTWRRRPDGRPHESDSDTAITWWPPPHIEMHARDFRYDPGVSARVHALVVVSIMASCYFTLYSGGPFQSAYSQVLIAYPLFAANVARNNISLTAVYIVTGVNMGVFELIRSYNMFGFAKYSTQDVYWYRFVTVFLLIISGVLAFINNGYEEDDEN